MLEVSMFPALSRRSTLVGLGWLICFQVTRDTRSLTLRQLEERDASHTATEHTKREKTSYLSFSIGTDSARRRQQTLESSLFAFLFLTVHRAADLLVKIILLFFERKICTTDHFHKQALMIHPLTCLFRCLCELALHIHYLLSSLRATSF